MKQNVLFAAVPVEKFDLMSKEDVVELFKLEQEARIKLQQDNERLRALHGICEQKIFYIDEKYILMRSKLFGKSSERSAPEEAEPTIRDQAKVKKRKIQLPSLRYPDAPLVEQDIELQELPSCKSCSQTMIDSGMTEDSEHLTVIPKQFLIIRQKRHKYCCKSCYSSLETAPLPPSITPGSSYSDDMKIDVALSKYCDLIPIERYSDMAGREGLKDLPPQSLIEGSHQVADYVVGGYDKVKKEAQSTIYQLADETRHRMLENHDDKPWYLWGFSNAIASYFEIRDTRSGDIASEFLINSKCQYLVSDVFSGYAKAVRETNIVRALRKEPLIANVYCNSHARRKFKDAELFGEDAKYFVAQYKHIYHLESQVKNKPPDEIKQARYKMRPYFRAMRKYAQSIIDSYPQKSTMFIALNYFLKNYKGLTYFTRRTFLPIDNNAQERALRNPVIGRKTWYGKHSKRGARTAAILFTLVESCKLNKINPRAYFNQLVKDLHAGKEAYSPHTYKINLEAISAEKT